MKINEILVEAEIDALIAQAETNSTIKQPGIIQRFNASANRGSASAAQRKASPGIINTSTKVVAKGVGAITNTVANAPQGIPSSYTVKPKKSVDDKDLQPTTTSTGEPIVAPANAEYLRKLAKNKVATKGTNSPEVDAVIRSAGLLK